MKATNIPFLCPEISDEALDACLSSIRSGWLAFGSYTAKAETLLAEFFSAENFLITSSCTASLQLALMLENIGPGDEVITTPLTWVATSNVILYQGATVKFADVDPKTGLISIEDVVSKITPRTKAVITVDLYGAMLDYKKLRQAIGNDVVIVEDAAHAIGSKYNNSNPGSLVDYCCFSFHAAKNITSGQGGGLICKDPEKANLAKLLRRDGVSGRDGARAMYALGHKFDATDFQSAMLIDQVKTYPLRHAKRKAVYETYERLFQDFKNLRFQHRHSMNEHSGHMFVLWLDDHTLRAPLLQFYHENGISASVHYNPVHLEPYYRERFSFKEGSYPIAEKIGAGAVSLPTYPGLEPNSQQYIANITAQFFAEKRK